MTLEDFSQRDASGDPGALALVNARVTESRGDVLRLSRDGPTAVLVEDGRISYVGDSDAVLDLMRRRSGPGRAIDVHGAVVAPGLVDAHIHAFDSALDSLRVSCLPPGVDDIAALKQRLADCAATRPAGAWVVGAGYDDTRLGEHRHPSRTDLDSALPDHPAVIGRVCGHMSVANTLALRAAGIDAATADPPGGTIVRDASGSPTGLLLETAQALVRRHIEPLSASDIKNAMIGVGRQILSYGITSICEALLGGSHPLEISIWSELLSGHWD